MVLHYDSLTSLLLIIKHFVMIDGSFCSWYAGLDSCKWMLNMSTLLYASKHVADTLARRPVLVHCSDGWDRTPQIVSLAQIILDPHYRTFKVTVELSES